MTRILPRLSLLAAAGVLRPVQPESFDVTFIQTGFAGATINVFSVMREPYTGTWPESAVAPSVPATMPGPRRLTCATCSCCGRT